MGFLIFLSVIFMLLGCGSFTIYIVFKKFPQLTEKTGAALQDKKHKKDVRIPVKGKDIYVDNLVKCVYTYKVGEKYYVKRYTHYYCTSKQAPYMIPIVYIKRFPKISYVNTIESTSELSYLLAGILNIAWGIMLLALIFLVF